jgi:chromosome segregation ATPase
LSIIKDLFKTKKTNKFDRTVAEEELAGAISDSQAEILGNNVSLEENPDDALSAKALFAVVTLIDERRKMQDMIKDLKNQLLESQTTNNNLLQEKKELYHSIEGREQQVVNLEKRLADLQQQLDQVNEELAQAKLDHAEERERLLNQAKEWELNYETLNADMRVLRENAAKEQLQYQEALKEEKMQHNHTLALYQQVLEDNKRLIKQITAFATQFSNLQPLILESAKEPVFMDAKDTDEAVN